MSTNVAAPDLGSEVACLGGGVFRRSNLQLPTIQGAIGAWDLEKARGLENGHIPQCQGPCQGALPGPARGAPVGPVEVGGGQDCTIPSG